LYDVYLALARVGDSLPLEVLIDAAALHEIAPRCVHRADDDFPASEGGSRVWTGLFYNNLERQRLKVGVLEMEVSSATKEGAVQIRLGDDDANVIFRRSKSWAFRISYNRLFL
jgi:hypothetical protein